MKSSYFNLLQELNTHFNDDLIQGDIKIYLDKIFQKATIVSIFENGKLQAFIAYYKNNVIEKKAYLTMLAVAVNAQNKGLGKRLLDYSIQDLLESNFKTYALEVHQSNLKALQFYKSHGFTKINSKESFIIMNKQL